MSNIEGLFFYSFIFIYDFLWLWYNILVRLFPCEMEYKGGHGFG